MPLELFLASFSSDKMRWPADAIRAWEAVRAEKNPRRGRIIGGLVHEVLVDSDGDGAFFGGMFSLFCVIKEYTVRSGDISN